MKAAILTFHNTPNYGATLQCYALHRFLEANGADVEVVNYMPPHGMLQYFKSLFLGRRRSFGNFARLAAFWRFVRDRLRLSGAPICSPSGLTALAGRYDIAFTGSDEVWKVDHMRKFDPSFYLSFLEPERTRLCSYAASASTVTDLRLLADAVRPLLARFAGIAVRDPSTAAMVRDLLGTAPVEVLDPTLIWDFAGEDLPPMRDKPYVAVYSWLGPAGMAAVRAFADRHGLEVVCVGCRNPGSDADVIGIGPEEWLRLIKHSSAVVTDFFHGTVFSLIFERPFFAHVDAKKRMKLEHILGLVGLEAHLHGSVTPLGDLDLAQLRPDWEAVRARLAEPRARSQAWVREQLAAAERGERRPLSAG